MFYNFKIATLTSLYISKLEEMFLVTAGIDNAHKIGSW